MTVQSGICIDSATIWINQSEDCNESFSIYIPNVFSPNGDGVNDELQVFPMTLLLHSSGGSGIAGETWYFRPLIQLPPGMA